MTGTHEEVRVLKPANGTPQMRAVDRKDLKLLAVHPPHPAGDVSGRTVPRACVRITVLRQPRLVLGEPSDRPKRNPRRERAFGAETGQEITKHGYRYQGCSNPVE